jgi:hypothetical protein
MNARKKEMEGVRKEMSGFARFHRFLSGATFMDLSGGDVPVFLTSSGSGNGKQSGYWQCANWVPRLVLRRVHFTVCQSCAMNVTSQRSPSFTPFI